MFVLIFVWILLCLICTSTAQLESNGLESDLKVAKVIVCAIVRHEEPYIDEWLQYNKYLGFDLIYLYDNADEPSSYLAGLPQVYGDFVQVQHYPGFQRQIPAYDDCFNRYKKNNTWLAIIDADEFIVLRKHSTIQDFLLDVAPKGGAVALNWARFSNSGIKKREAGPVVARFTYTTAELSKHTKTMSYLRHVEWVNIHNTNVLPGHPKTDVRGRPVPNGIGIWTDNAGNKEIAYIAHYHTKSLEEYTKKRRRGRADLEARGGAVSYTAILKEFEKYNEPYYEVEDTNARDFYLRHSLGTTFNELQQSAIDVNATYCWR